VKGIKMTSFTEDNITWRALDYQRINWPAINIKNYDSIYTVQYPFRFLDNSEEMTHPDFNAEWIDSNVPLITLESISEYVTYHSIYCCESLAKDMFGKNVSLVQDGRMGGWLVLTNWKSLPDRESYYYEPEDEWSEEDQIKWNTFAKYVENMNKNYITRLVTEIYLSQFLAEES
jgi:hypothetical protein